MDEKSIEQLK